MQATIEVAPEVKQGRNKLAATVVGGHAVKHIYNSSLQSIILPEIGVTLGLSGSQFGALNMAGRFTSGVTTMGAGYLGDRFANKSGLMLAISLGILGISYFLLGSVTSYWYLFAVMLLAGIGPSLYHPPAIAALSRKFPDKRGFAVSLHGTGGSVGNLIGPILVGALLAGTLFVVLTWQNVLHYSVVPALFFAFMIFILMRDIPAVATDTESLGGYFSDLWGLLKKKAMIMLVFLTALRSMGQSAIMAFLPFYLRSAPEDSGLGYSPIIVALYISSAQIVGVGAQPVMGYLSDKFGRKIVLVPALTALGLLYMALTFANPGFQLILVILAMGAFQYSLHSIFIAAALDVSQGESQSTVVSLIYGAGFFGTFAPLLAGFIADATEIKNAFLFAGSMVVLSAVILGLMRLPKTANQIAASD